MERYKTVNGVRLKRVGGYVSWDGRGRDAHGFPRRRTKELHAWVPVGTACDDCGAGTAAVVAALVAAAPAGRRNVECRESWEV